MSSTIITFIGCGNMTQCLIQGMSSSFKDIHFNFSDHKIASAEAMAKMMNHGYAITNNQQAVAEADIVVLAIKPQQAKALCEEIALSLKPAAHLISIMAGINCQTLNKWCQKDAITRVMPNTPSFIGKGASGVFHTAEVKTENRELVLQIMQSVGVCLEVDKEDKINVITAVSGSSPAYFFGFIENMQKTAIKMGLTAEQAELLVQQSAYGASSYLKSSKHSAGELRKQICSPGGTTEQALKSFAEDQWDVMIEKAMTNCYNQAIKLTKKIQ